MTGKGAVRFYIIGLMLPLGQEKLPQLPLPALGLYKTGLSKVSHG